jgi:hypothetical protein
MAFILLWLAAHSVGGFNPLVQHFGDRRADNLPDALR